MADSDIEIVEGFSDLHDAGALLAWGIFIFPLELADPAQARCGRYAGSKGWMLGLTVQVGARRRRER